MKLPTTLIMMLAPTAALAAAGGSASYNGPDAKVVAGNSIWRCEAGVCRGQSEDRRVAVERVCKDLARKVGEIGALNVGATRLDADQLADCNRFARAVAPEAVRTAEAAR